jgi:hypothetical protein
VLANLAKFEFWASGAQAPGSMPGMLPSARAAESGTRGTTIMGNSITIVIEGANKNPDEIADAVEKRLSRKSLATRGHPDWRRR